MKGNKEGMKAQNRRGYMTYKTSYPKVEEILKRYSYITVSLYDKHKTLADCYNALRDFRHLLEYNIPGTPAVRPEKETESFKREIEFLEGRTERLSQEILQETIFQSYVDDLLNKSLNPNQVMIIKCKYKEGLSNKKIISKIDRSMAELYRIYNEIYRKIDAFLKNDNV